MIYDAMDWRVEFHRDFVPEFRALAESVQDEIAALVEKMRVMGPTMKRPASDTLDASRFSNMKELRFEAGNGVARCICLRPDAQSHFARCRRQGGRFAEAILPVSDPQSRREICGALERA